MLAANYLPTSGKVRGIDSQIRIIAKRQGALRLALDGQSRQNAERETTRAIQVIRKAEQEQARANRVIQEAESREARTKRERARRFEVEAVEEAIEDVRTQQRALEGRLIDKRVERAGLEPLVAAGQASTGTIDLQIKELERLLAEAQDRRAKLRAERQTLLMHAP